MEYWLRCKVSPGQFSIEYAVSAESFDGRGFSLFAPQDTVEFLTEPANGEPVDGYIRVQVLDRKEELCLIRLPRQIIGLNEYVTVKEEQLQVRRSIQKV